MGVDQDGVVTLSGERTAAAGTPAEPVFLLVEVDDEIVSLRRSIEENRKDVQFYEAELNSQRLELESIEHARKELARTISREEGEIAQLTERKKQLDGRVLRVVSAKELAALQNELAGVAEALTKREEALLAFYEQQEAGQKKLAAQQAKVERMTAAVGRKTGEKKTETAQLALRITRLEDLRGDHLAQLEPGLRARYLKAYERNGGVVAYAITDNSCGGCGWSASSPDLRKLRQNSGKLFDCQKCGRMLTWVGAPED